MSGTIDWDPKDAFILTHVVEEGSFTAAAKLMELPKSTVSRRVSELEGHLGIQLLRRTTRRLHLTEAGQAFYAQAAQAVEALKAAELAATTVLDEPRGRLRITAPAELGTKTFQILLGFGQAFPEVHLDLDLSNRYVDLVHEGFDVALRGGRPPQGALAGRALLAGHIYIVASAEYLKKRGTPKRASDLIRHDSILFPSWVKASTWPLTGPRGKVKVPIQGRLTVNNLDGVRTAALNHCGLALLPESHCHGDLGLGKLKRVLPGYSRQSGGLWLVYPRSRFLSARLRAFLDYMHRAFEQNA